MRRHLMKSFWISGWPKGGELVSDHDPLMPYPLSKVIRFIHRPLKRERTRY
jgi:hypothetical protein